MFGIGFLLGRKRTKIDDIVVLHLVAAVRLRNDPAAFLAQSQIAVGMIEMPVGVDHEIDVVAADFLQRGLDLRHQHWRLVINDQRAVLADRHRNIATQPEQDIKAVGDFLGLDFRLVEVPAECFRQLVHRGQRAIRWRGLSIMIVNAMGHGGCR